ncbi:glycerophosphodiester phosphodiesterase family protein [Alteromonas sp. ASW11-36]|uniref:Glycerophosphodiester phosphodiesterase family protein n=1 Tax=Alteromonas arenosi TaxID=3055817 RepID=A0ABT7T0Z8_9ALTE|nr:glycerophosphodiester phosphodiesterase family protein [Alteromonas sp. ASW11-36]MDM7862117.1 glycerophosphodiester phosphodiesterase family protein [Alteromonas sp. ASW11-36]
MASYLRLSACTVGVLGSLCMTSFASAGAVPPNDFLNPSENVAEYINCLAHNKATLVSVHRAGPKPGFPENALESMQEALKQGPMLLEVDIRETADGHLVLMHDVTLDRTTTGSGDLGEYTLAELADIRLVDNDGNTTEFAIPTLQQVLAWADERAIVQLDLKRGIDYAQVVKAVVEADAVDSTLIIAYRLENVLTSIALEPKLSFSYSINDRDDLAELEQAGVSASQIVAWTGVVDGADKPVWPELESLNLPFAAGAFWHLENEMLQTGDVQAYIDLAEAGVDIIGSDNYWMAYSTLATRQNISEAIKTCEGRY